MNYVDYTNDTIERHLKSDGIVLVIGAGYRTDSKYVVFRNVKKENIIVNDGGEKIDDWCIKYKDSSDFRQVNLVILSRVLEHFPVRWVDWYLYQIYTLMAKDSKLICVVPDMPAVANQLQKEFTKKQIDLYKIQRLTFELLSEGDHVFDRHALWTSEESVKYYLEMEKLFKVQSVRKVIIDTSLVPKEIEFVASRA